jgi:U6 snRNA-associated Sm-like protein LSm1
LFCDIPRGTYLVRGENVLLIGEVDLDADDDPPPGYEEGKVEEVFAIQKGLESERRRGEKRRARRVGELWGGEVEGVGEVLF